MKLFKDIEDCSQCPLNLRFCPGDGNSPGGYSRDPECVDFTGDESLVDLYTRYVERERLYQEKKRIWEEKELEKARIKEIKKEEIRRKRSEMAFKTREETLKIRNYKKRIDECKGVLRVLESKALRATFFGFNDSSVAEEVDLVKNTLYQLEKGLEDVVREKNRKMSDIRKTRKLCQR